MEIYYKNKSNNSQVVCISVCSLLLFREWVGRGLRFLYASALVCICDEKI